MSKSRVVGLAVSVFSVNSTSLLEQLTDCTLNFETKTAEAKGVQESPDFPWPVGYNWSIEGEVDVATLATLMSLALAGAAVPIAANSGANAYSGNVIIQKASHAFPREALQKEKFTMLGQGALTIS